ncbi:hypothetical protein KCU77_g12, partial [Aureobasidium melanogenum]
MFNGFSSRSRSCPSRLVAMQDPRHDRHLTRTEQVVHTRPKTDLLRCLLVEDVLTVLTGAGVLFLFDTEDHRTESRGYFSEFLPSRLCIPQSVFRVLVEICTEPEGFTYTSVLPQASKPRRGTPPSHVLPKDETRVTVLDLMKVGPAGITLTFEVRSLVLMRICPL